MTVPPLLFLAHQTLPPVTSQQTAPSMLRSSLGQLHAFASLPRDNNECQHLEGAVPEGLKERLSIPQPPSRHALSNEELLSRSSSRC